MGVDENNAMNNTVFEFLTQELKMTEMKRSLQYKSKFSIIISKDAFSRLHWLIMLVCLRDI